MKGTAEAVSSMSNDDTTMDEEINETVNHQGEESDNDPSRNDYFSFGQKGIENELQYNEKEIKLAEAQQAHVSCLTAAPTWMSFPAKNFQPISTDANRERVYKFIRMVVSLTQT
jgi:hypothetical protein